MSVTALGYIGFNVSDPEGWDRLLGNVFGLQQREDSAPGRLCYRIDDWHHRISLYPGAEDSLGYLGWEVASEAGLEALAESLALDGTDVQVLDPAVCEERAVKRGYTLRGPDDVRLEFFFGGITDCNPPVFRTGVSGFNTGDLGMGHVVMVAADRDAALKWYQDKLGFLLSDHIHWDGIEATFLHCNPRHHSLALINEVHGLRGGDFIHLMLEARNLDDVGRAYDVVQREGHPVAFTYGRHTNDQTTSFYVYTPSGWQLEFGAGGQLIDDTHWKPRIYDAPNIWGQTPQPPPDAD